ncbi:PQQ-dependent sugar dehydrogenase [Pontibacter mangrovi]|nr:PQQ-dependent sugar dehydrogenase [Pontibacter mangrovi]
MKELYKAWRSNASLLMYWREHTRSCRGMLVLLLMTAVLMLPQQLQAQPDGFVEEPVGGEWDAAVGLTFSKDGDRMYVWEKGGKVWIVEDGEKLSEPLLDISEEVGNWGDHGLLGFTLDPNFESNRYIYLLYVVDRHHLMNFGKGGYSAAKNEYNEATIARVARYKVREDGLSTDMSSRKVLIGESVSTGIPILYVSHGIGTLMFGEDGSLLVSIGDGATANGQDTGWVPNQKTDNFVEQALQDGILAEVNNVGAFRAQQVNSLNGKILRIDPNTGDGLPSNPFYNSADPRAAESRVWELGLRNPFRFTIRPGTGGGDHPGDLYIGDVGWQDWEEINVATQGGMNFGWPLYEGFEKQSWYYDGTSVPTPDIPNPLYGEGNCDRKTFYFNELIQQPKATEAPYFGNFCNWNVPIPDDVHTFVHSRPAIDWANAAVTDPTPPMPLTRTGTFNGEEAAVVKVGEPGSPVTGEPFYGSSSTGGIWYSGGNLPAEYQNVYFFGDYGAGWIKVLEFDENNKPTAIRNFIDEGATVTAFAQDPSTGELYYINYGSQIMKVNYYEGNMPPKAVAEADKEYGTSPLIVNFTGSGSTDPEEAKLTYSWDFGDGSEKSTEANPSHTYTAEGLQTFEVVLTVTDPEGLSSKAKLEINLNNTPPVVNIVSPEEGAQYPMNQQSTYNLKAEVTDKEDADENLSYEWVVALHHNTHSHPEPAITDHEASATIAAVGCDGDTYFYRFTLTVTDPGGLSATDYVDVYPDCSDGIVAAVSVASPANNATFEEGEPIELTVSFADETRNWASVDYYNGSSLIATVEESPFSYTWENAPAGTYNIKAKATDVDGHSAESEAVKVVVGDGGTGSGPAADLSDCLPGLAHYFDMDEPEDGGFMDIATSAKAACTTCPQTLAEGLFGGAQQFNGTDTGMDYANVSTFNWASDASFSIGLWMKTDADISGNMVLIGRDATSTDSGVHWWIGVNPEGHARFALKDATHAGVEIGGTGPELNDGNWHYIMAVRDSETNMNRLFVDGVMIEEAQVHYDNDFADEAAVNIGYLNRSGGFHYTGALDEVKVYSRAVSSDEVKDSYNGGSGTLCGQAPLGITDNQTFAGKFDVYPNPNVGLQLNIVVVGLEPVEETTLTLVDITGRTVLQQKVTAQPDGTIYLSLEPNEQLATGLYNLLLYSPERKLSQKVLIAR